MKKIGIILIGMICFHSDPLLAQNSMGIGTDTPNPNAVVEMVSPGNDQGLLVPRLTTTQRTALTFTGTENGLLVYDSDENQFYVWVDPDWQPLSNSGAGDMLQTVYDIDADGVVDSAANAGFVNGFTVETAVPVGAVFTDTQAALDVPYDGSTSGLLSTDVQNAIDELALSSGGGDMLQSVYDIDADGVVDSTVNAGLVNGFAVETAVPAGAVFTDSQAAADVGVTASGNLTSTDVQAALEELQNKLDTTNSSPWAISGVDLNYSAGNVGVGTTVPQANFQVGDQLGFFHFENAGFPVDGEVIADNLYAVGDSLYNIADGRSAFIFFDSGAIEFLHGDPLLAGQNALSQGQVSTSLRLNSSRDAEFSGAVEIGSVRDSTNISPGLMAFEMGQFWGFTGSEWVSFGGLSFPSQNYINDGASNPFFIQNDGGGGVARFVVNNTSAFGNPLEIQTNSDDISSTGIEVNNDGLGSGIRVDLNNASNTNNAITGNTLGADGSAGYFYINNASNPAAAVIGIIDAGAGNAVEGYTNGTGPAGRFTNANTSNGSVAFVVQNDGTNSAATFSNSALAATAAVEILNNGTGAGLTIQNPGGTTFFGDSSAFAGKVAIGHFDPATTLDVNGDVTAASYVYSAPQTHYYSKDFNAFKSLTPTSYQFGADTVDTGYGTFSAGADRFATAPVNLPDGAVITELQAWMYNNTSGNIAEIELIRRPMGTTTREIMATLGTTNLTASVQSPATAGISNPTVDNSSYTYYLQFRGGADQASDTRLYDVRLTYTVSSTH